MGKVIGIDLGTTNSCVAVMEGSNAEGDRERGRRAHHALDRRLHRRRRAPGRPAGQAPGGHQSREHHLRRQAPDRPHASTTRWPRRTWVSSPTRSSRADNGDAWVEADGKKYSPSQISAFILQKMKETAEDYLGETVDAGGHHRAGLLQRRPAPGDQGRRQDRRPRSAAHHQRADRGGARLRPRQEEGTSTIAVYDLGGGTFDISILEIGDGVFEVKSTNGDTFLGGEDFDKRIIDYLADEFKKEQGIDLTQGQAGAAAPEGSRREGQDRAVLGDADRDQPAVHHGRRDRAEAPRR